MEGILATTTAYGLYIDETGGFSTLTIDMTSGDHSGVAVSGFNNWDELTRVFTFDSKRMVFYLPQANFTNPAPNHVITLYTVDAVKGTLTVAEV
jgi:hypothetical protein